jgi:D-alanine-D-alanine ligase
MTSTACLISSIGNPGAVAQHKNLTEDAGMSSRGRLLVLWNQVEEDVYEKWRVEGPRSLEWDPNRTVPDVGTVAEEMAAFLNALRAARFEVEVVNVEDSLERVIGAVRLYRPDAVFNLIEFFNDDQVQEAYIAGLFELLGVPYTGSPAIALATCQNKYRTKLLLDAADLPTSPFFICKRLPVPDEHDLQFPLIVKPAYEDASGGISHDSVVHDQANLELQVARVIKEFEMPALVEEYIDGREIHVALLGNNPPEVLPLFEMEFDDSEFNPTDEWRPQMITFKAKWDPHSKDFYSMDAVVPAQDLEPETEEYIREIAAEAFRVVGVRDYCRIDMRVDWDDAEPYILEVNPNPDLVDGAAYMMCATASGRSYAETLGQIADLAIARGRRRVDLAAELPSDDLLREFVKSKTGGDEKAGGNDRPADEAAARADRGDGPPPDGDKPPPERTDRG